MSPQTRGSGSVLPDIHSPAPQEIASFSFNVLSARQFQGIGGVQKKPQTPVRGPCTDKKEVNVLAVRQAIPLSFWMVVAMERLKCFISL